MKVLSMWDIKTVSELISSESITWEEKETKAELFQYNFYMRFLYIYDIDKEKFKNKKSYKILKCHDKSIISLVDPMIKQLEEKYNKDSGAVYFVKLMPQQYPLRQYYDFLEYSEVIEKFYIPIVTNKDSTICTEENILYAELGKEFFAKDDDLLAVYNFGDSETIYLIIDLLPKNN